ncbi:helix-turn-helix transcriptional regulator [Nocardiopsis sp. CNT312]|uniref:helix-turn-helix domain-containing protein n=1 Tax=Nocardiopsis sp. CNT312 TaxID=1137268 RepID=UPI00048EA771|nr:helix-turn-helix transcriptional regulator [Nocardiopsis sp. CNT312]
MDLPIQQQVSATITAVMTVAGDTTTTLASGVGQRRETIHRKIHGKRQWSLEDLAAVATHYGITPADLLAGADHAIAQVSGQRTDTTSA